jgi:hypothetical protein
VPAKIQGIVQRNGAEILGGNAMQGNIMILWASSIHRLSYRRTATYIHTSTRYENTHDTSRFHFRFAKERPATTHFTASGGADATGSADATGGWQKWTPIPCLLLDEVRVSKEERNTFARFIVT